MLSRMPLDINRYVAECTNELSQDVVRATWEGSQAAKRDDVAWVTAHRIASIDSSTQPHSLLSAIDQDELVRAQQEDPSIGEAIRLKESGVALTDEARQAANPTTRRILYEWDKLHLENGILYR